jgi:hypothetical protein
MPRAPLTEEQKARRRARNARSRRQAEDAERTVVELGDYRGDSEERGGRVPPGGRRRGRAGQPDADQRGHIKVELGQRWSQIVREVEAGEYTWDDFVRTLDPDELARGQLKNAHGGFGGRPPKLIPRAFYLQCVRELRRRFDEKMQERLIDATDELIELSRADGGLPPKDRAKVLQYLVERVMGPIPKTVTIKTESPWEDLVVGVFGEAPEGLKAPGEDRYEGSGEDDDDTGD